MTDSFSSNALLDALLQIAARHPYNKALSAAEACVVARNALDSTLEPPADVHPEAYCEQCKRPNAVWFAPSEIWNVACRDNSILCPVCFIWKTEAAGIKPTSWMIAPEGYSAQPPSGVGINDVACEKLSEPPSDSLIAAARALLDFGHPDPAEVGTEEHIAAWHRLDAALRATATKRSSPAALALVGGSGWRDARPDGRRVHEIPGRLRRT